MPRTVVGADNGDENGRVDLPPALQAAMAEMVRLHAPALQAAMAEMARFHAPALQAAMVEIARLQAPVIREAMAEIARLQAPALQAAMVEMARLQAPAIKAAMADMMLSHFDRTVEAAFVSLPSHTLDFLNTSAQLFGSFDAASVLRHESEGLIENPAHWLAEADEAADSGNQSLKAAAEFVRYLFACFFLLVRRLDPSASRIEAYAPVISLLLVASIASALVEEHQPEFHKKFNEIVTTPIGILAIYLTLRPLVKMNKKEKRRRAKAKMKANKKRTMSRFGKR